MKHLYSPDSHEMFNQRHFKQRHNEASWKDFITICKMSQKKIIESMLKHDKSPIYYIYLAVFLPLLQKKLQAWYFARMFYSFTFLI